MLAIKLILQLFMWSSNASAFDETWGIFQFRKNLSDNQQIMFEYVTRDRDQKFLDLVRLSYGFKKTNTTFLFGIAKIDFAPVTDELRFHQYVIHSLKVKNLASGFMRAALEERLFEGSQDWHLRARLRFHLNLLPQNKFGVAVYNETFYTPNGYQRFQDGVNENRFGPGLRYIDEELELYLFHTLGSIHQRTGWKHGDWLQFHTVYNF